MDKQELSNDRRDITDIISFKPSTAPNSSSKKDPLGFLKIGISVFTTKSNIPCGSIMPGLTNRNQPIQPTISPLPTPPWFWQVLEPEIRNCPLSAMTTSFPEAVRPQESWQQTALKQQISESFRMLLPPFLSGVEMETDVFGGGLCSNDSQKKHVLFFPSRAWKAFVRLRKHLMTDLPRHLLNSRCSHCFPISCHLARGIAQLRKKIAVLFEGL